MFDREFTAIFLTDEASTLQDQGLPTPGDEYRCCKKVMIDLTSIESVYETDKKVLGKTVCVARTKTSDVWELCITFEEYMAIKKGLYYKQVN